MTGRGREGAGIIVHLIEGGRKGSLLSSWKKKKKTKPAVRGDSELYVSRGETYYNFLKSVQEEKEAPPHRKSDKVRVVF